MLKADDYSVEGNEQGRISSYLKEQTGNIVKIVGMVLVVGSGAGMYSNYHKRENIQDLKGQLEELRQEGIKLEVKQEELKKEWLQEEEVFTKEVEKVLEENPGRVHGKKDGDFMTLDRKEKNVKVCNHPTQEI